MITCLIANRELLKYRSAPLREILRQAGFNRSDSDTRAIVVGGLKAVPSLSLLDTPFDFDPMEAQARSLVPALSNCFR